MTSIKLLKSGLLLVAVLLLASPAKAQQKLDNVAEDQFFNKLEETLGQVKSLFHPFMQTRHVELFSEDMQARGVTIFAVPAQIRHELTEPFQTVLISGENGMARYEKTSGKEWKKITGEAVNSMSQVTSQIALWLRGQVRSSDKQYELSVFHDGAGYQIKMVPRNNIVRKNISWIELRLPEDCSSVSSVTMHEAGGDYTKIDYSAFAPVNKPVTADFFIISGPVPTPLPTW